MGENMKKNIILIDYENVQDVDLEPLLKHDILIKVFHGEVQKFTSEFTSLALELGKDKIELIKIKGNGKNALDFHIAFYIGKLLKEIENPFFHIISHDTGFKPLVEYLIHVEKTFCLLEPSIADIPLLKKPGHKSNEDWYSTVVGALSRSVESRPKRLKTLQNQVLSICKREISDSDVEIIVKRLVENKFIECKNETVIYCRL
jgi:hypothetical protein